MQDTEIWKPIKGFEGHYEVSNTANIRSVKSRWSYRNRVLKARVDKDGYRVVMLSKNGRQSTGRIARITAIHFIPNPLNLPQVNHINGIKTDDRIENLEWVTNSQNQIHCYRVLGRKLSPNVYKKGHPAYNKPRS